MGYTLTSRDFQALAELRHQLRLFLRFSETAARSTGLEPRQHQLLLALKGLPRNKPPQIKELAERLQIRHHSAVELTNRLAAGGYVVRKRSQQDRRAVLLALTPKGERVLHKLSLHHQAELRARGPALAAALGQIMQAAAPARRNGSHGRNSTSKPQ